MKSLVLLTFLSVSPGDPAKLGKAEFYDDHAACQIRMHELRQAHVPGSIRCKCHETVEEVAAEGNDAI